MTQPYDDKSSSLGSDISSPPSSSYLSSVTSPFSSVFNRFSSWKSGFGLQNPGSVENLQKEVKMTHLTNYMFDGVRADLTKGLSMDPAFQVTHSFTLASQSAPPSYHFGAVFANASTLLQGGVGDDGGLNARFNKQWSPSSTTKVQASLAPGASTQNMVILEHDYSGQDYFLNFKALNPSPTNGTGIYVGSILQSITPNLAFGVETLFQRPTPEISEISPSYLMKYTSTKKDWIATAQLQPAGMLQATYWQKLSEKVDVAVDMQLIAAPQRREAVTTLGAKYDLRMSTVRAQIDSTGKVSALLEQKFGPTMSFLFGGEIEHLKNSAKVGVGVMIETTSLTPEEMGYVPNPSQP